MRTLNLASCSEMKVTLFSAWILFSLATIVSPVTCLRLLVLVWLRLHFGDIFAFSLKNRIGLERFVSAIAPIFQRAAAECVYSIRHIVLVYALRTRYLLEMCVKIEREWNGTTNWRATENTWIWCKPVAKHPEYLRIFSSALFIKQ